MALAADAINPTVAEGAIPDTRIARGPLKSLRAVEVTDISARNIIVEAGQGAVAHTITLEPDSAGLTSSNTLVDGDSARTNQAYSWAGEVSAAPVLYGVKGQVTELAIMDASRDALGGKGIAEATVEVMRADIVAQKDTIGHAVAGAHTNVMAGFSSATELSADNYLSAVATYVASSPDTAGGQAFVAHPTVLHGQLLKNLQLTDAASVVGNPQIQNMIANFQGAIGAYGGTLFLSSGHVATSASAYRNYFCPLGNSHGGVLCWRQRWPGTFGDEEFLSPDGFYSLRIVNDADGGAKLLSARQRIVFAIGRSSNVLVVPTQTAVA